MANCCVKLHGEFFCGAEAFKDCDYYKGHPENKGDKLLCQYIRGRFCIHYYANKLAERGGGK